MLPLTKENDKNSRLSKCSQQIVKDVSEENEQLFGHKTWNHELVSDTFFRDTVQVLKRTAWNLMLRLVVIILAKKKSIYQEWPVGLVAWFSLRVREVPGSTPGQAPFYAFLEVPILQSNNKNRKIKPKDKNKIFIKQAFKHTSNTRKFNFQLNYAVLWIWLLPLWLPRDYEGIV